MGGSARRTVGIAVTLVLTLAAIGGIAGGPALAARITGHPLGANPIARNPFGGDPPRWHAGNSPPAPPPVLAGAGGAGGAAPTPSAGGVAAVLAPLITAAGLGGRTSLSVVDVPTGQQLYGISPDTAMVPASVTKLVTGAAVLATRGSAYRISTRAVAGANPGEVVLIGGGDPTLSIGPGGTYPGAARLDDLAVQVRAALGGVAPTRIGYDGSKFAGDSYGPGWDDDIPTGGSGGAITALMTDGGRVNPRTNRPRYPQPDLAAAVAFAAALGQPATAVAAVAAPVGARELAAVQSPPLVRLVEIMMTDSDNVIAESLARQVAIGKGQPATFAGGAAATKAVLAELGVEVGGFGLVDGSGLSRFDRLSPALLTAVLATSARPDRPDLHAVFSGLPVAGYSGTLTNRYRNPQAGSAGAGSVRAKTGTLTGVSSIAGIVVDADGRVLAFAVVADAVTGGSFAAQEALDRIAAALAGCGCRQ